MAPTPQIASSVQTTATGPATRYSGLAQTALRLDSNGEGIRDIIWHRAGTLRSLFVRVTANSTSASSSVTVRKNAADGAMTVSIGSAATGTFEDTTNTVSVADGDDMAYSVVVGTGGTITMTIIRSVFIPDTAADTVVKMANGFDLFANATSYQHASGSAAFSTNSTQLQTTKRVAGTWRNLSVNIGSNSRLNSTTHASRKNASAGNQSVSIGAGATGDFEDVTNTDSIAATDMIDYVITYGSGTENLVTSSVSSDFVSSGDLYELTTAFDTGRTVNFNTTIYYAIAGGLDGDGTETNWQTPLGTAGKVSDLNVRISANTIATTASTLTVRKGASNTVVTVSIGAGSTGVFTDTTNSVDVVASDLLDYALVTPNTSGSLVVRNISVKVYGGIRKVVGESVEQAEVVNQLLTPEKAQAFLQASGTSQTISANTTNYIGTGTSTIVLSTTENLRKIKYRTAGTMTNLLALITANSLSVTLSIKQRKNGADGSGALSITTGATGAFEDTSGSDSVSAGDDLDYSVSAPAGSGSATLQYVSSLFDAKTTPGTITRMVNGYAVALSTANATRYCHFGGVLSTGQTVETNEQAKVKMAGTVKNLAVYISANARTNTTTVITRKNTADGNVTVSIGSGATGLFEDTSNSDSVAVDDLINLKFTTGSGNQSITFEWMGATFQSANGTRHAWLFGSNDGNTGVSAATTAYGQPAGRLSFSAGQSNKTTKARVAMAVKNLVANISANTVTATSTITLQVATADTALAISVGSGATGQLEDVTDSIPVQASEDINYEITTGSTGTTLTFRSLHAMAVLGVWKSVNETEETADAFNKIRGLIKLINESVEVAEAVNKVGGASGLALVKIVNETEELSEALNYIRGRLKVVDESEEVAESVNRLAGRIRAVNETANIGEGVNRLLGLIRAINESANIAEAQNKVMALVRAVNEDVQVAEAVNRLKAMSRNVNETTETAEAANRIIGHIVNVAESVQIAEALNIARGLVRNINETENVGEALNYARALVRVLSENVEVAETVIRITGLIKAINESLSIAESANMAKGLVRSVGETVNINEAVSRVAGLVKAINEAVEVAEGINRLKSIVRAINEAENVEEAASRVMALCRNVNESEQVAEQVNRLMSMVRQVNETVDVNEAANRVKNLIRAVNETEEHVEAFNHLRTLVRVITEAHNTQEAVNAARGLVRVINESGVNIGEAIQFVRGLVRVISETQESGEVLVKLTALGITLRAVEIVLKLMGNDSEAINMGTGAGQDIRLTIDDSNDDDFTLEMEGEN